MKNTVTVPFKRFDTRDVNHKNILLVEDNEGDAELLRESFEDSMYSHSLFIVNNGEDALEFLRTYEERPDLIILDINMPRMTGHEALKEIKATPRIAEIPVIMLTSSETLDDVRKSKELGANGYLIKPSLCKLQELLSFMELVKTSPDTFIAINDDE